MPALCPRCARAAPGSACQNARRTTLRSRSLSRTQFRTFEQQAEKRRKQLAELEAKEGRTAEEEAKLEEYKKEVASWDKFFAEQKAKGA